MKRVTVLILTLFFISCLCAAGYFADKDVLAQEEPIKALPQKADIDTNGDGKIDRTEFYKDGKIEHIETDTKGDGKIHEWAYYNKDGALIRIERDTKGNGKIDEWVYYENGKPVKAQKDTVGDGKPHTWIYY